MMIFSKSLAFGAIFAISFISIFTYFIPLCLKWQLPLPSDIRTDTNKLPIDEAIKSIDYLVSVVASTSMSIHMLVDLLGHGALLKKSEFFSYRDCLSNLVILVSLLVPDFIQLFCVIRFHDPLIFHVVHRIRNVMILFATFGFLAKFGGKMWRSLGVICGVLFGNIGLIVKYYSFFVVGSSYSRYSVISLFFLVSGTSLIFLRTLLWFKEMLRLYRCGLKITTDEYCCNVYLIAFWISIIWFWWLTTLNGLPNWYEYDINYTVQVNVLFSTYYILIAVFQRHAAIREAVTYSVRLCENI